MAHIFNLYLLLMRSKNSNKDQKRKIKNEFTLLISYMNIKTV